MKNSKIAFVTEAYIDTDFLSGGVKLNFLLLNKLYQCGYTIDLFVAHDVRLHSNIFNNVYKISDLDNFRNNYNLILSDKAVVPSDITYIHDHSYPYRMQKMSNKFMHAFYKIFNRKRYKERVKEYFRIKANLEKTNKVIVSSNVLKEDMINNYGIKERKIEIIPPPIEIHDYNKKHINSVYTFGISAIGFNRKGGYVMMKAIQKLKQTGNKFKVVFIYSSKNLGIEIIKKIYRIEQYCEFIPEQKDMGMFYNSIDCLVMPSLIEPFGMVATEALSLGCPVITGMHCGASDYIVNGKNGYKYDFSNKSAEGLADAMKKIMNNKEDFTRYCKESVKHQNIDDFVNKYISIMNMFDINC